MAYTVSSRVIHDGTLNVVVGISAIGTGIGELDPTTVVDMAGLSPRPRRVSVREASWDVKNCTAALSWDNQGADDDPIVVMPGQGSADFWFSQNANRSTNSNGNIMLSTTGTDSGAAINVTLTLRKKY